MWGAFAVKLFRGTNLPGDRIDALLGFDGNEPHPILRRQQWLVTHEFAGQPLTRIAVAINTYYNCVAGGYYLNRNLIGLVQEVLESLGLFVVVYDVTAASPQEVLPVEPRSSLEDNEEYALVDSAGKVVGLLFTWGTHWGDMGPFYGEDSFVLDLLVPAPNEAPFQEALKEKCRQAAVEFADAGRGPQSEPRPKAVGLLRRVWNFLK
jgi:hypothetical protein